MMHPSLSELQREKCKHLDNFDYHSGYQQALIDAEQLLEDAYLAGFFDGEGCVYENPHIDPPNIRTYLKAANNCLDPLELLRNRFGGSIQPHDPPTCNVWTATGNAARKATEAFLPFTLIKTKSLVEARNHNFGIIERK